ncbi:MAG: sugar transferase [Lishizhenia sp.]
MSQRLFTLLLILLDFFSASIAWGIFYAFRKVYLEKTNFTINEDFYLGIFLIPACWIILHALIGTYFSTLRLHRMKIFNLTFISSIIGTVIIFFFFLLDDTVEGYKMYYKSFFTIFFLQFILNLIVRFIAVSYIVKQVHTGKIGFKTLLIGGSQKAVDIYREIQSLPKSAGNDFIGFVNLNGIDKLLNDELNYLGHANDLVPILESNDVEEIIIALDSTEHEKIRKLIAQIQGRNIRIKLIPDMYDILSGSVKMNNIFGALLIEIDSEILPVWQRILKRLIDITASGISLILLTPIYITLAILVKSSSKGPVFFKQERIGKNGNPFQIIKFRTMYVDAEKSGPQLSSSHDPRITSVGRFMRKSRLDEFPQFWNVLIGEMSLVGPRPERQFFIDQIVEKEPEFLQLNKVKPGITSWGQVKYGYAENVSEMIQRMKFDLLYLKNMSIALDFKIMLYTVLIVLKAKGK